MLVQLDLENELFNIALEELRIKISNKLKFSSFK
jgi:hypothetical protein